MYSNGIDSTSTLAHAVVTGAGATIIANPDHTTQIIAIIGQLVALAILFFQKKAIK